MNEKESEELQKLSLFYGMTEEEIDKLIECSHSMIREYKAKELVMEKGRKITHFGVVLEGRLQMVQDDYSGNRDVFLTIEPAQLFGEVFAFAGMAELPADIEAIEKSRVLFLDYNRIRNVCRHSCTFHSNLLSNLLKIVAQNNLALNDNIEIMSKRTTKEKIMAFLVKEAKRQGAASFEIEMDRQTMADYLGVERSAMSAEIGKLRKEGRIQAEKRRFTISDQLETEG